MMKESDAVKTMQLHLSLSRILREKGQWSVENVYLYDWESDVLGITRSNYITEYEIKVSRGDYLRDLRKLRHEILQVKVPGTWLGKKGFRRTITEKSVPNYFYYVTPEGLLSKEEVPGHAGLIELRPGGVYKIKKAPRLHEQKVDRYRLTEKLYYQNIRLRCRVEELHQELKLVYERGSG